MCTNLTQVEGFDDFILQQSDSRGVRLPRNSVVCIHAGWLQNHTHSGSVQSFSVFKTFQNTFK